MREATLPKRVYGITMLYHFDWYRIIKEEDIRALGWDDIILKPENLVVVEWGDKFPGLLPKDTVMINIAHTTGRKRLVKKI